MSYQKIIETLGWEPRKLRLRASKKKFMEAGRQEEEIKIELCVVVVLCRVRTDSEDGIVEAA